jgi:hypothetical protein
VIAPTIRLAAVTRAKRSVRMVTMYAINPTSQPSRIYAAIKAGRPNPNAARVSI